MATVIDALLVTLGLDGAKYTAGMDNAGKKLEDFKGKESKLEQRNSKLISDLGRKRKETEERDFKDRDRWLKGLDDGYKQVIGTIAKFATVSLTAVGVKNFITGTVDSQAQLSRLAVNLRTTGRDLDAWGKTIEQVGGKREDMLNFFQSLQGGINAFKNGDKDNSVVQMFTSMGISFTDAKGKIKDYKTLMGELSDTLKKYDSQDQMRLIMGMGGGSQSVLDLLRLQKKEMQGMYDEQYRLSGVTEESEKKARRFQQEWARVKSQFESVGQELFIQLLPAIERLNSMLLKFSGWLAAHKGEIGTFFDGLSDIVDGLVEGFQKLNSATGGWAGRVLAVGAAFVAVMAVIRGILALSGLPLLARMLGIGGAGAVAGGAGLLGTAGLAVLGSAAGLYVAKKMGVPDVNTRKGIAAIRGGHWFDASKFLSAGDFLTATKDKALGMSNEDIARKIEQGAMRQIDQQKAGNQKADISNEWLKEINSGIAKMGQAFNAGVRGLDASPYADSGADRMSYGAGRISGSTVRRVRAWAQRLDLSGLERRYGLSSGLLSGVMARESQGIEGRTSAAGATGLFQFMPATARRFGIDPNDPRQAAAGAARYLSMLKRMFGGDERMALAAYNWGEGNLKRKGMRNAPRETRDYVPAVLGYQTKFSAMMDAIRPSVATGNSVHTETHIGQVTINTRATDAQGIARDIAPALDGTISNNAALAAS